ncbi:MAG: hypothetical protein JRH11_26205, partial [Deltaproteobacteria bacterium]|nr:hypothetical protein [Deltaproteobacteria bacterium]
MGALAACIVDRFGEDALTAVAAAADLSPADVRKSSKWVRYERFERLLIAARERFSDDDAFRAACGYRLDRGYGPMRLLFHAMSPGMVYQRAFKSFSTISGISSTEIVAHGRTFVRTRYRSTKKEHRLVCLSRQGQATMLPRLWGLPKARLVEHSCIAWGDDACEYEIHWYELARWRPILAGLAAGGLAAWAVTYLGLTLPVLVGVLPALGALAGYFYEIRRTNRENLRLGEDYQNALRDAMAEETETRK